MKLLKKLMNLNSLLGCLKGITVMYETAKELEITLVMEM